MHLVALHRVALADTVEIAEGRRRVRLSPIGLVKTTKGDMVVDADGFKSVEAAFVAHQTPLVVDYEHQTLGGKYASPDGKAPAAGWVYKLWLEEDGLYGEVEWTAEALEAIRAKEYGFLSPVVKLDAKGRVIELHSIAVTNVPAIAGMGMLAAKDLDDDGPAPWRSKMDVKEAKVSLGKVGTATVTLALQDGTTETYPAVPEDTASIVKLRDLLIEQGAELDDQSSLSDILTAALDMLQASAAQSEDEGGAVAESEEFKKALAGALELKDDATPSAISAKVDALIVAASQVDTLREKVKKLEDTANTSRIDSMMESAFKAGVNPNDKKVIAALRRVAENDPEGFDAVVATAALGGAPEGKLVNGEIDISGNRTKIIAASKKEYESDPLAQGGKLSTFVNSDLEAAELSPLTDTELAALA